MFIDSIRSAWRATLTLALAVLLVACNAGKVPDSRLEVAVQGLYNGRLSHDGNTAIIGSINHGGSLWDLEQGERLFNWNHRSGEFSQIIDAAFASRRGYALTATPQTLVLWNSAEGGDVNFWTAPSEILNVALLANGNFAVLGMDDHTASLFDVQNGGIRQVYYHEGRVNSVDAHREKGLVLTGSDDFSARLWRLQNGEEIHRWEHEDDVQLVRLSPDGSRAFTMSKYDRAAVWNTSNGRLVGELPLLRTVLARGEILTAARFDDNAGRLLTGKADGSVQMWSIPDMQRVAHWQLPRRHPMRPTRAFVTDVAFAGDNRFRAISSEGLVFTISLN